MWKNINGKLIHTTDSSRINFRTTISMKILDRLEQLSAENDTYVNYLLEQGLQTVINNDYIDYNKIFRPKDRVQYQSTFDKELLKQLRQFAEKKNYYLNDVLEYAVDFIDPQKAYKRQHRNRIKRV